MNISNNCVELIKHYEGLYLNAYLDPIGIPTIGYGTIRYPDSGIKQVVKFLMDLQKDARQNIYYIQQVFYNFKIIY